MSDQPAVSPTGKPYFTPDKIVLLVATVVVAASFSVFTEYGDTEKWARIQFAVVSAVAALFGIASPGARKAALVFALVLLPTLSGCAIIKRVGTAAELAAPQVLECVGQAGVDAFPQLVAEAASQLMAVVAGGKFDVEPVIDQLVKRGGPLMACAIREVLLAWQQAGTGAGVPLPDGLERQRLMFLAAHVGQAHLLAQGYVARGL